MSGGDGVYRVLFIVVFSALTVLRAGVRVWSRTVRERIFTDRAEWGLNAVWVVLGVPLLAATFLFIFHPALVPWAYLPLPGWLRWTGGGLGLAAVLVIGLVHVELGRNFSPTLRLRPGHTLVTTGLYRWARHPMYTAYFLLFAGGFLLSANWVIGVTGMGIISTHMTVRVRREEALLVGRFGEVYMDYAARTSRFLPLPRFLRARAHRRLARQAARL
jgi:protein-S-isoprenylcysteine O-methyltransferase Ste14